MALPTDGRAVTSWPNKDEAFENVVQEVRRSIDSLTVPPVDRLQDDQSTPVITTDQADSHAVLKRPWSIMHLLRSGLLMSLGVTATISLLRFAGALQPLELGVYDWTMRSRYLKEGQDENILVIKVIAQDEPDRSSRLNTLSDERLDQLLELLKQYEPSVIGFDNFLNHKIDPKYKNIQEGLQFGALVTVCKATDIDPSSFKAPTGATSIGFGDITIDHDGIVRRHLLQMDLQTAACSQSYGLSTLLASYYLDDKSQKMELPFHGNYGQVGNKKASFLSNYMGGYQQFAPINKNDNSGFQMMLNYRRSQSLLDGLSSISINEIFKLSPSELTTRIKDRIILIGTTENAIYQDIHKTPYGETIPGVFLQAQMTSQLVNAALRNRPFIWAYPLGAELPIIWLAAGFGWLAAIQLRVRGAFSKENLRILVGLNGIVIIMLFVGSVVLLTVSGYWFPLVPTGLSFVLGCSSVTIHQFIGTKLKRLHSSF